MVIKSEDQELGLHGRRSGLTNLYLWRQVDHVNDGYLVQLNPEKQQTTSHIDRPT